MKTTAKRFPTPPGYVAPLRTRAAMLAFLRDAAKPSRKDANAADALSAELARNPTGRTRQHTRGGDHVKRKAAPVETRTTTKPAWLHALCAEIHAGRLLVESAGILSVFTPDIATADGALVALWVWNDERSTFPGYLNMFRGRWHVYRNGRRVWIAETKHCDRLYRLFSRALGVDTSRTHPETVTREVRPAGPRRIPALVAAWSQPAAVTA